jgi:5-hydroxyisourate hydrolase/2-oxo-4-hydroxy-4-carboxy-5-ureidoimidazoline decarboxylase
MTVRVTWEAAFTACASKQFADLLVKASPYDSVPAAIAAARNIWWHHVSIPGWLEAFAAHPKIGDAEAVRKKYSGSAFGELSQSEQATAMSTGNELVFEELAVLNQQYEQKFGHIFIICASGKSAEDTLTAIRARIQNPPYEELSSAAREQMKITELRLTKLLSSQTPVPSTSTERAHVRTGQLVGHLTPGATPPHQLRSPITTHVLDTALGCPAEGLPLSLHRLMDGSSSTWDCIASGTTNSDGRVGNLLPPSPTIQPGRYQMRFDTATYLSACHSRHPSVFKSTPFYPEAVVDFVITPELTAQHFHIPLLLSPYGFSTYRGS